jgi:excisionase family DNA binding protein
MLLTIKDLSQWLQIKPSTLYTWVAQRKIPFVKINGLIRFQDSEINGWIRSFQVHDSPSVPRHVERNQRLNLQTLIAQAKREAYTVPCGKPDQDRATRKEGCDGAV